MKIIGGGISGLAAAISLARRGRNAKIIEKNSDVGGKFTESVHAIRNYNVETDEKARFKKEGLRVNNLKPIHKIVKYAPSGAKNTIYSKDSPLFYAFKRGPTHESLDYQLYEQAVEEGVKIEFKKKEKLSNADIIACGPLYFCGMGFGAHFKDCDLNGETIHFFLNNDYAPKGYAYVIPYGKHEATVVTTCFDPFYFNYLSKMFNSFLNENKVANELIGDATRTSEFAGMGFFNVPKSAFIKGKYLVGEFAGFVEADRGFGVRYAINSALLAAKAIDENKSYDDLWKKEFEADLIESFKKRLMFQKMTNEHYEKLVTPDDMSIEEYKKEKELKHSSFIKRFLLDTHTKMELDKWRKKFNFEHII